MHRTSRPLLVIDIAIKVVLFALLALAVLKPDLPQFAGKAMTGRAIGYPIAALFVPAVWLITQRVQRRRIPFPVITDILVTLPFLIDVAGNALDLYDTISWWDDLNHYMNWLLLFGGVAALFLRSTWMQPWLAFSLITGWGAVLAIAWELSEYFTFLKDSPERATAYVDTLGDLTNGTLGAATAGAILAIVLWRRRRSAAAVASTA